LIRRGGNLVFFPGDFSELSRVRESEVELIGSFDYRKIFDCRKIQKRNDPKFSFIKIGYSYGVFFYVALRGFTVYSWPPSISPKIQCFAKQDRFGLSLLRFYPGAQLKPEIFLEEKERIYHSLAGRAILETGDKSLILYTSSQQVSGSHQIITYRSPAIILVERVRRD
jgi:hypothetical protein